MQRDAASFRDPSGHVYRDGKRVLRTVTDRALPGYEHARDSGALQAWIERGWVVGTRECEPEPRAFDQSGARYLLEHDPLQFISYPYEWTFAALKAAALLHLDLQLDAFPRDITLSDASAYNIQFEGVRPVFIDVLSFQQYTEGEYWTGHRQFCEQFLNPLLLRAQLGVPHNAWYRGTLEGITATELNAVLPVRRKLSWNLFSHVTLPARLAARRDAKAAASPRRALPRAAYAGLLTQLRSWIARLTPRHAQKSVWRDYEGMHTYSAAERARKRALVARFAAERRPALLWDVGCNAGEYAELALKEGAALVIGFDADHGALDEAFERAASGNLNFLPLYMDAANPTPDQGWNQAERAGLARRNPPDALLALAITHHLAIARNVPLENTVEWLVTLAPRGVIEFVPKNDPTVQLMLSTRTDVFDDYSEPVFASALGRHARIIHAETISAAGRRLYVYERP